MNAINMVKSLHVAVSFKIIKIFILVKISISLINEVKPCCPQMKKPTFLSQWCYSKICRATL